jgi:hypothetical protein
MVHAWNMLGEHSSPSTKWKIHRRRNPVFGVRAEDADAALAAVLAKLRELQRLPLDSI